MFLAIGCFLFVIAVLARIVIGREAKASAVDEYYWRLVARAYRDQKRLPVSILDKYLMEDETQAYPPLFGFFLGSISDRAVLSWVMPILELLQFLALGALLYALDTSTDMLVFSLACYVAAPVLIVYNTQLTSRILGDLFLFSAMALQIIATMFDILPWQAFLCWVGAIIFLGLVIATHKMTLQLYLALLPFWCWALEAWQVPITFLASFGLYVAAVGPKFVKYQLYGHWDIIRFWYQNWRDLGGHQFHLSPLYGDPAGNRSSCLHVPGLSGVLKYFKLVVSYVPLNCLLPTASLLANVWPPVWVLVWLSVVYVWAFATLLVPALKCLGGGHLYMFNAVVPGVIYLTYLPTTSQVLGVLVIGVILTMFSLFMAIQAVKSRPMARKECFKLVLAHLQKLAKARLAVFPLQTAEIIAGETDHAVLWGGHSVGFQNLEGFFPVLYRPLEYYFLHYDIEWVIWDCEYWPEGQKILIKNDLIGANDTVIFGQWRLAKVKSQRVTFSPEKSGIFI